MFTTTSSQTGWDDNSIPVVLLVVAAVTGLSIDARAITSIREVIAADILASFVSLYLLGICCYEQTVDLPSLPQLL